MIKPQMSKTSAWQRKGACASRVVKSGGFVLSAIYIVNFMRT